MDTKKNVIPHFVKQYENELYYICANTIPEQIFNVINDSQEFSIQNLVSIKIRFHVIHEGYI